MISYSHIVPDASKGLFPSLLPAKQGLKWLQYSIVTIINNVQVIIKLPNNIDIKFIIC